MLLNQFFYKELLCYLLKLLVDFGPIMLVFKQEYKKYSHYQCVKRERGPDALPILTIIRISKKFVDNYAADRTA